MIQPLPVVLSFSASDSSGGAGMQADILTQASLGCHPLSVVTAITAQNTVGVDKIMSVEPKLVSDQARAVLNDIPVHAFKIGLLGNVENIAVIAEVVTDYPNIPLVMDPVLASGRGDDLANEEMVLAMRELLFPHVTILTPNSLEARKISQLPAEEDRELDLRLSAARLLKLGCDYILITGTHEHTNFVVNTLYDGRGVVRSDKWQRLSGSYHGSGCTLASAIAAFLANGLSVYDSVCEAQNYTWKTLNAGFRLGMGQYLPDRLFCVKSNDAEKTADYER